MQLRAYQQEAVESVYRHLREHDDNPVVVCPTGAGKSLILAQIASDAVSRWQGRVLILAHVRELLEQNAEKLQALAPELSVGIYSAGLKSRDTEHPVIVAGIQSVYKRACELDRFDLIIVDEVHLIPPDGDGMYRQFLAEARKSNPHLRVIGLTATPFRMTTGSICGAENILNSICYEIGVRELIVQGYLSPLISKASREKFDTSDLHIRGGEFVADEVEELMDQEERVRLASQEILDYTRDRKACLIFASGVQHGKHVAQSLRSLGAKVETVFGDTLSFERDQILKNFRTGQLPYLVNVGVLTTGFDAPNIDCVALLRPTMSPGLYSQMVGRGLRLAPGKQNCLVLDFGGNVLRHGPIDALRIDEIKKSQEGGEAPAKECPACHALVATGYSTCPQCGFVFPTPERRMHNAKAGTESILSGQVSVKEHLVQETRYAVHVKRDGPREAPRSMRVDYRIGWQRDQSEWICFEHTGFARAKAESWWRERSDAPVPETAEEAVRLAEQGALAKTRAITVRSVSGEKYDRVTGYDLDEKPFYREPGWDNEENAVSVNTGENLDDSTIPF